MHSYAETDGGCLGIAWWLSLGGQSIDTDTDLNRLQDKDIIIIIVILFVSVNLLWLHMKQSHDCKQAKHVRDAVSNPHKSYHNIARTLAFVGYLLANKSVMTCS